MASARAIDGSPPLGPEHPLLSCERSHSTEIPAHAHRLDSPARLTGAPAMPGAAFVDRPHSAMDGEKAGTEPQLRGLLATGTGTWGGARMNSDGAGASSGPTQTLGAMRGATHGLQHDHAMSSRGQGRGCGSGSHLHAVSAASRRAMCASQASRADIEAQLQSARRALSIDAGLGGGLSDGEAEASRRRHVRRSARRVTRGDRSRRRAAAAIAMRMSTGASAETMTNDGMPDVREINGDATAGVEVTPPASPLLPSSVSQIV